MRSRTKKLALFTLFAAISVTTAVSTSGARSPVAVDTTIIPKVWDDEDLKTWTLPIAALGVPPTYVSESYYYRMPERAIYKSYPVYTPGKEPPGYMEWLARQEPEIAFDASKLKSEADWIEAGKVVFNGARPGPLRLTGTIAGIHDPAYYAAVAPPVGVDGVLPAFRYSIEKKGQVVLTLTICAGCHTRVIPGGPAIPGAQGNFPFGRSEPFNLRETADAPWTTPPLAFTDSAVPWLSHDPAERLKTLTRSEYLELSSDAKQPGVVTRAGASWLFPPKLPDLIGVRDRKYLDATGLVRHRSIVDLMRYATSVNGIEQMTSYGSYHVYDPPADPPTQSRLSDAQLYALARYLYSLEPPTNPNKPSDLSRRGERVFRSEGCIGCHTPPYYTNNMLTPASGFVIPEGDRQRYDILPVSVGTDAHLAMLSRKGTGYYRVPSLKGVWYRGPFEHNGSVATLEDWFDPRRLRDDYVPTGFRGFGVTTRPVKGHEFGLRISANDKRALIAFLRTL